MIIDKNTTESKFPVEEIQHKNVPLSFEKIYTLGCSKVAPLI